MAGHGFYLRVETIMDTRKSIINITPAYFAQILSFLICTEDTRPNKDNTKAKISA
jgi:hypothetical protein